MDKTKSTGFTVEIATIFSGKKVFNIKPRAITISTSKVYVSNLSPKTVNICYIQRNKTGGL